jgi:hypothetical protein
MWKRVLAGILGTIAVLAAIIAFRYANQAYDNFRNPWLADLGGGLMWLLTLGAFVTGIHFLKYCVTGNFFRLNRWIRALILGALFFFLGFTVSAVPAALVVSKRWPRDIHAENVAMLTSIFVGAALAVAVCVVLIRTGRRNGATSVDDG